ncbi:MAG: SAM-dependent methyltransferase [Actinomycetes bacterium]
MAGCCDRRAYERMFGPRFAHHRARRYRRRGLDRAARDMVDFVQERGLQGASVLEIGGGVGELHVELLRRGAARAVNLELSGSYEDDAARLLGDLGLAARVDRRLLDLVEDPQAVEPADVVVLHRVVCCYPDYVRLLSAASGRARRLLVFSYPRTGPVTSAVVALQNAVLRLLRSSFRTFAHPPEAMLAVLAEHGLRLEVARHGAVWQVAGLERVQSLAAT